MYPASTLQALGFDEDVVTHARAQGHVVGRGEGFVSREWRAPDGRIVAVHTGADDREVVCAVPFVGGLGWDAWQLVAVREAAAGPHVSTAHVTGGGVDLVAVLPDFAARRKMFPVGLEVQASVVVIAEDWRPEAELPAFVAAVEGDALGGVVVSGTVARVEALGPVGKVRVERDGRGLWVCGRVGVGVKAGAQVVVAGRALVRIGAPIAKRGMMAGQAV